MRKRTENLFRTPHARLCLGRPETLRSHELEKVVFDAIEDDNSNSISQITVQCEAITKTIWNVVKRNLLYRYTIQRAQALLSLAF